MSLYEFPNTNYIPNQYQIAITHVHRFSFFFLTDLLSNHLTFDFGSNRTYLLILVCFLDCIVSQALLVVQHAGSGGTSDRRQTSRQSSELNSQHYSHLYITLFGRADLHRRAAAYAIVIEPRILMCLSVLFNELYNQGIVAEGDTRLNLGMLLLSLLRLFNLRMSTPGCRLALDLFYSRSCEVKLCCCLHSTAGANACSNFGSRHEIALQERPKHERQSYCTRYLRFSPLAGSCFADLNLYLSNTDTV